MITKMTDLIILLNNYVKMYIREIITWKNQQVLEE